MRMCRNHSIGYHILNHVVRHVVVYMTLCTILCIQSMKALKQILIESDQSLTAIVRDEY